MMYWCCTETSGTLTPAMRADLARPLAGADHDLLAGDAALVGDDGRDAAVLDLEAGDRDALEDA